MEKRRGHTRNASNWSTASYVRKRTTTYNEKRDYHTALQKFVRGCQYGVIHSLERFFLWYGELVASYPVYSIIGCIIVTALGGCGLIRFYEEGDAASLVIPVNSQFRRNIDWLDDNFPREIRVHSVIYTAENVLTPEAIRAIYEQRVRMDEIVLENTESGQPKSYQDLCIRVPILKFPEGGFAACQVANSTTTERPDPLWETEWDLGEWPDDVSWNTTDEENLTGIDSLLVSWLGSDVSIETLEQWSDAHYPELYCGCIEATETACYEQNIVELWGDQGHYNEKSREKIQSLTQAEILNTINHNNVSGIFLKDFNFVELLGDVKYDQHGYIIGAGAVEMKFFTTVNVSSVKEHGTATRGEKVDYESFAFEGLMIDLLWDRSAFPAGLSSYVNVQRQFFDSFVGQTFKDSDKLVMGYILVFVYVNLMLSKMNCVEQRVWLSVIGILSVAMGMILGYGLCSMFGLFYSAAHTVIPFLLLGIGIDNIFVITQTFNTMESTSTPAELTKRFGQTMKHAGVAVSVTTFTDVIAFLVGSNTVLPGLQSFCIYAAAAIFAIYALQVTHFVAWFSLDQRRQEAHRDGCLCCYTHKNFEAFEFSKVNLLNTAFRAIGELIVTRWFQVLILAITSAMMVFGVWGTLSLTQEYQPEWLLPPEAEIAKWFGVKNEYYPSGGEPGYVMIKAIDIPGEFAVLEGLVQELEATEAHHNIDKVVPWHRAFRDYVNKFKADNATFEELITDRDYFRRKFTQFLYSPKGGIYQPNFWFASKLTCGEPAPDVLLQALPYQHNRFYRSSEWIPAMREVQQIVKDTKFSNDTFPIALTYINWETDAIVAIELIRNVSIALVCIFVTTLMTLGSWRGSIFVMMCVLFTCVNVCGYMHWWGLTIDITSMNIIIISVGLCVDFCAHIVHGFLTGQGSKDERVLYIMENIAPAVLNGGFSSMLALSLLVTSKSHIFVSFFKIFFMICVFGLFHGLILLPVVLCIVGPVDENNTKVTKRQQKLLAANGQMANGHLLPNGHSAASDIKYNIENRLNQETEVRESVPEERLLASELAEISSA